MAEVHPLDLSDSNGWPLVRIKWLDSAAPRGWQPLSEWRGGGSLECISVGYLYAEDRISKTIIPHLAYHNEHANRQGSGIMVIPAGAIVSIDRLIEAPISDAPSASVKSC